MNISVEPSDPFTCPGCNSVFTFSQLIPISTAELLGPYIHQSERLQTQLKDLSDRWEILNLQLENESKEIRSQRITKEAIKISLRQGRASILGTAFESLAPLMPNFGHNPKDCHFLGSPVGVISFDGLAEHSEYCDSVTFVEIKRPGTSGKIRNRELSVKTAIDYGKVKYEVFQPDALSI